LQRYIDSKPHFQFRQILAKKQQRFNVFPLANERSYYFFSARYALAAAMEALGLIPGDKILVPSYNCGSEVDPILHLNVKPVFYRIGRDLLVDLDDLQNKITGGVKAILVTHFLGFPQPIEEIKNICAERKLFLIEDCAHAFLSTKNSNYLGSYGDVAIFSLFKTLPIPNGGILTLNNERLRYKNSSSKPSFFATLLYATELLKLKADGNNHYIEEKIERCLYKGISLCAASLRHLLVRCGKILDPKKLFLVRPDSPIFLKELCTWGISGLAKNIMKETNFEKIKATRRVNFGYLQNHFLKNDPGILVFRKLSDGVCPLFFPIILESAESSKRVYERLVSQGIIAFRWWRFHPEVPWDGFPDSVYLKSRLLGLPIHQDLTLVHLDWIIEVFEKAYQK